MQWHPLFAHFLRAMVQDYYEVRTDMPVGDLPRQADIVLLRRTAAAPFVGIWRHLTPWNVLEFKGPSDDPALRDLDLLLEVGRGIDRRLNEERLQQRQALLARDEASWWYIANHIGARFLAETEVLLGHAPLALTEGLWRCRAWGHLLFLVSRDVLPVERESVPLHLVTKESRERELALAGEVVRQPGLWDAYGSWLTFLHPAIREEVYQMSGKIATEPDLSELPDVGEFIEWLGIGKVIDQIGLQKVIDQVGLQKVIDQVGLQKVMEVVSPPQLIATMGLDWFLARLTPEQLQELKRRLP